MISPQQAVALSTVAARQRRLERARERERTATRERVEAMIAARELGCSLQQVSDATGISRQQVFTLTKEA